MGSHDPFLTASRFPDGRVTTPPVVDRESVAAQPRLEADAADRRQRLEIGAGDILGGEAHVDHFVRYGHPPERRCQHVAGQGDPNSPSEIRPPVTFSRTRRAPGATHLAKDA